MNTKIGILALPLLWTSLNGAVLFTENFETGQTPGDKPLGATTVRPTTIGPTASVVVVNSAANLAGTGNGVRFQDEDSGISSGLEYNFVADAGSQVSAVRIDFDFAANSTLTPGSSDHVRFSAGEFNTSTSQRFNSSSRRPFEVRFFNDGTVDFNAGGDTDNNNSILAGSNHLTVLINDSDSLAVDYTRPDNSNTESLAVNSVAFFLNNVFVGTFDLDNEGPFNAGDSNLGRFGFNSSTVAANTDFIFDNLQVSTDLVTVTVPEASHYAFALLGMTAVFALYRRRAS